MGFPWWLRTFRIVFIPLSRRLPTGWTWKHYDMCIFRRLMIQRPCIYDSLSWHVKIPISCVSHVSRMVMRALYARHSWCFCIASTLLFSCTYFAFPCLVDDVRGYLPLPKYAFVYSGWNEISSRFEIVLGHCHYHVHSWDFWILDLPYSS